MAGDVEVHEELVLGQAADEGVAASLASVAPRANAHVLHSYGPRVAVAQVDPTEASVLAEALPGDMTVAPARVTQSARRALSDHGAARPCGVRAADLGQLRRGQGQSAVRGRGVGRRCRGLAARMHGAGDRSGAGAIGRRPLARGGAVVGTPVRQRRRRARDRRGSDGGVAVRRDRTGEGRCRDPERRHLARGPPPGRAGHLALGHRCHPCRRQFRSQRRRPRGALARSGDGRPRLRPGPRGRPGVRRGPAAPAGVRLGVRHVLHQVPDRLVRVRVDRRAAAGDAVRQRRVGPRQHRSRASRTKPGTSSTPPTSTPRATATAVAAGATTASRTPTARRAPPAAASPAS